MPGPATRTSSDILRLGYGHVVVSVFNQKTLAGQVKLLVMSVSVCQVSKLFLPRV